MEDFKKTDDEIIADFLGWKLCDCGEKYIHYKYGPQHWQVYNLDSMKFKTSWDWIMPVLEKISSHGAIFEIWGAISYGCRIYNVKLDTQILSENNTAILTVYEVVVEYIKWHNSQSK